ncbi:MAG: alpha-rhamnosidase [Flavisolibacter sp.]|nr:alpha-rhamnosidase [Flavisolibacter sp.]
MFRFAKIITILFWVLLSFITRAQTIDPALLQNPWKAQWITGPGVAINPFTAASDPTLKQYGVYKFRKTVELTAKPATFIAHVSADNRYKLFVNGKQVAQGPARGDLYFWNFETVDLAPYLQKGKNTVAALVWNDGAQKPEAQITYLTAFILQGNTPAEEVLNTNDSWKTVKDSSYQPLPVRVPGYYVAGPAELVNMNLHVKGWEQPAYDDSGWRKARMLGPGLTKDAAVNSRGWMLVPSPIPQMEMTTQRLAALRNVEGVTVPVSFPASKTAVTIPARTKATLLLDQGFLTNAYPTLHFSRGKDAGISMGYAEALYIRKDENVDGPRVPTLPKGNRNEVEGKIFIGKRDSVVSDGSAGQEYTPLWWRTYRYIQLRVQTGDEPLVLEDVYGTFTGYPFQYNAKLEAANPELQKMLEIGWRTARLCAFETYMDCPYYEQLQYIGDARIQALVSLYNSGDDRLVKNALTLMDHSRIAEGITLSRYPTDLHQQIPTFSLWWIAMLHDYWMYGPDSGFIKSKLPGERQVLSFFERYQQPDGSLKNVPYWTFTDWVNGKKGWNFGMAPVGKGGESAVLDLQLLWTYLLAAEMEEQLGVKELARLYRAKALQLKQTVQKKYWDASRGLYADTEEKDLFSQHTNSLAVLAGVISGEKATALAKKTLTDTTLAPASIYFKYYLHQAGVKAGLGNDYLSWLDIWRENMALGLTTWGETSDVSRTRSDCHAWGSSPNIEFFRTVLGIDSDAPGFSKVKIEPHLGTLKNISGEMPHPAGKIRVQYNEANGRTTVEINLPEKTTGKLVWKGKSYPLKAGKNVINLLKNI